MSVSTESFETPRDFERMLRDAGFSRSRAKAITAKGFRGASSENQATALELEDLLQNLTTKKDRITHGVVSPCSCGVCAGETKRRSEDNRLRCQQLHNDLIDGNKSRWKAWKAFSEASGRLSAATRRFVQNKKKEGIALGLNGLLTIGDIGKAIATRTPNDIAAAIRSGASFLRDANNYFGDYDEEYKRFIKPYIRAAERALSDAKYLDRIFWQQEKEHKREGCSRLPASVYNRPR